MKKKFEQFGCEFKNESECEEDLDSADLNIEDAEEEYFED